MTNIDILAPDNEANDHLLNMLENEYLPRFHKVTRPNTTNINKGTCVDNIFAKSNLDLDSYKILQFFTDHLPLFITIDTGKKSSSEAKETKFVSFNKLKYLASQLNWELVKETHDPNVACNVLIDMIKRILQKATIVLKNIKSKMAPRKCWISKGIMTSCKHKRIFT